MNAMPPKLVEVLIDRHSGTCFDAVDFVIDHMVLIKNAMEVMIAHFQSVNLFLHFRKLVKNVVLFHFFLLDDVGGKAEVIRRCRT